MTNNEIEKYQIDITVAIVAGDVAELQRLLQTLGSDAAEVLNTKVSTVQPPLISALQEQNADMIGLLLEKNADLAVTDATDVTAADMLFQLAYNGQDPVIQQKLRQIVEDVLKNGLRGDVLLFNRLDPMLLAVLRKSRERLNRQNKVNVKDKIIDEIIEKNKPQLDQILRNGGEEILRYMNEFTRFGHIVGSKAKLKLQVNNYEVLLEAEGAQSYTTEQFLTELIREYIDKASIDVQQRTRFQAIIDAYAGKRNSAGIEFLSCGDPNHLIGVAVIGDKLALCNRGGRYSDLSGGVKIFQIKKTINQQILIKDLQQISKNYKEFETKLAKLVDLKNPLQEFKEIKNQKYGNCSYANIKGLIVPLLQLQGDAEAYKHYKEFTRWMRDREIDRIIDKLKQATKNGNTADEKIYFIILQRYLFKGLLSQRRPRWSAEKIAIVDKRVDKIMQVFNAYPDGRTINLAILANRHDPKELNESLKMIDKQMREAKVKVVPRRISSPTLPEQKIDVVTEPRLSLWQRFIKFIKGIYNSVVNYFSQNDQFSAAQLHSSNRELSNDIMECFIARKAEIQQLISQAQAGAKIVDQNIINIKLTALEKDWQRFVKAEGREDVLLMLSNNYIMERRTALAESSPAQATEQKRNSWLPRFITGRKASEQEALDKLDIYAKRHNKLGAS
jgi:hypothetical protein